MIMVSGSKRRTGCEAEMVTISSDVSRRFRRPFQRSFKTRFYLLFYLSFVFYFISSLLLDSSDDHVSIVVQAAWFPLTI